MPFSSVKLASHTGSTPGRGCGAGEGDYCSESVLLLSVAGPGHWAEFLGLLSSDSLTGLRLNQLCLPDTWPWGL